MACGRPVIATKVGGNPELVHHGETGYLVAPFAPEEVASAGQILASDPYLRHRMGARARSDVEAVFSLSAMVERYENLYTDLLSGNRVPVHELSAQAAVSADG